MIKILLLVFCFSFISGQIKIFNGFIGNSTVSFTLYNYTDDFTEAVYTYSKYDSPIYLSGNRENRNIVFTEKDETGKPAAILEFKIADFSKDEVTGKWIRIDKQKSFDIKLKKETEFTSYDEKEFLNTELIQQESLPKSYFKVLVSKQKGNEARVTGIRIYEKKTDRLIQEIKCDCCFRGFNCISTGDFNFDDLEDFSIFEENYTGPNTSSIYYLRNPGYEKYSESGFAGTSLEFDTRAKLVYEHNQCCGGRSLMKAVYKIVENKMVLIEKKCLEYDENLENFTEKECD